MSYIPDPIEIMESNIEKMGDEYKEGFCMMCGKEIDYEPYPVSARPDAPAGCAECAGFTGNELEP